MAAMIKVAAEDATDLATSALAVNLFQGVTQPGGGTCALDASLAGPIAQLIADGGIKENLGELTLIHTMNRIPATRVMAAGPGSLRISTPALRVGSAATCPVSGDGTGIGGLNASESTQVMAEAALLVPYKFDAYRSNGRRPR